MKDDGVGGPLSAIKVMGVWRLPATFDDFRRLSAT